MIAAWMLTPRSVSWSDNTTRRLGTELYFTDRTHSVHRHTICLATVPQVQCHVVLHTPEHTHCWGCSSTMSVGFIVVVPSLHGGDRSYRIRVYPFTIRALLRILQFSKWFVKQFWMISELAFTCFTLYHSFKELLYIRSYMLLQRF